MTLEKVKEFIIELEIDDIQDVVKESLKENSAIDILAACCEGMLEVGKLYVEKEYYLPELVLAGETMEEALIALRPELAKTKQESKGKVITATVKGDLHDIGKNIVVTMLTAAGYEIIDMGKDVEPKAIAKKAKEENVDIVALSALLTMTVGEIETTVEELKKLGIRDKVKVIVGGAPMNQELAEKLGADISCDDAVQGIDVCNTIMAEKA
ncbi:MAG: cobalamin B12-binding domain-containing protein [Promethearchaeota archaeon]